MGSLFSKNKKAENGVSSTKEGENKEGEKDVTAAAVDTAETTHQEVVASAESMGQDVAVDAAKLEAGGAVLSPPDVAGEGDKKQSDQAAGAELQEGAPGESVSVEHSERFRTEQRTKVTPPSDVLECPLSESSLTHTEKISPERDAHPDSDRTHTDSPVTEQFEHLTLHTSPICEFKAPSTEHASHEETPKNDTPNPEPENDSSLLIDFGAPMEKTDEIVHDDVADKKGSLINTDDTANMLGIGDDGPPESTNSTEIVAPQISTDN